MALPMSRPRGAHPRTGPELALSGGGHSTEDLRQVIAAEVQPRLVAAVGELSAALTHGSPDLMAAGTRSLRLLIVIQQKLEAAAW